MLPLRHKSIKQFLLTKNTMLMKFFTKLFAVLAFLCVSVAANAEKVYADLSKYANNWADGKLSFSWTATYGNQLQPGLAVAEGDNVFAGDLSGWENLVVEVDELHNCDFFRILIYQGQANKTIKVTSTGQSKFNIEAGAGEFLTNITSIVLSGSNGEDTKSGTWGQDAASFKITAIYLERPDDPLIIPKENLQKSINIATALNASVESAPLAGVIARAVSTKASATTVEELQDAKSTLDYAITEMGFTPLTSSMFHVWDGEGANANQLENNTNFESKFGSVGQGTTIWGTGSVFYLQYANLSAYEKLILTGSAGATLRVLMNRKESNSGPLLEFTVVLDENGIGVVDLANGIDKDGKKISDDGFAHLNAIKTPYNGQTVTVNSLYVYKAPTAVDVDVDDNIALPTISAPEVEVEDPELLPSKAALLAVINDFYNTSLNGLAGKELEYLNNKVAAAENALKGEDVAQIKSAEKSLKEGIEAMKNGTLSEILSRVYATFEKVTDAGSMKWDADNMNFSWDQPYSNQVHSITLPNGDITQFEYIYVDCDILSGDGYRIMFYATDKGTTAGGITIITESGLKGFKLSDFEMDPTYLLNNSEFCLSGYNASGKVHVNAVYFVPGNGTTTAINGISQKSNDSNVIFNLKGQRLSQPAKGINIINGKKVVIK